MQHEAHHPLGVPSPVVHSYLTDVYCNGFAVSLLVGRVVEAEYEVFSGDAILQAVQYGLVSRSAHDQMRSACARQGALLRVPWLLVGQWFRYRVFSVL